ncbi:MAG TPA: hypothetical protein VFP72_15965 [Kineosporiaceae bacterium]|nr:hypothetical protein [Kineosporiaceae bacterium]
MRTPLPPAARAIRDAVMAGVSAAGDREAFTEATTALTVLDPDQVRAVLSGALRPLLEDLHPDGLTGDDLRAAVQSCARAAAAWFPVDPDVLVVVLTGAFGIHPEDDQRPPAAPATVTRHACVLLADLLPRAPQPLPVYLERAFAEIARAEIVEQP